MATDLARAHRACARTTRRHARNFYFAFLSLPRAQRRAVYALYAFCHMADCVADDTMSVSSAKKENGEAILSLDEPKTAPSVAINARLQELVVRQAKLDAQRPAGPKAKRISRSPTRSPGSGSARRIFETFSRASRWT
jgi:phytoene/squalene synthetase